MESAPLPSFVVASQPLPPTPFQDHRGESRSFGADKNVILRRNTFALDSDSPVSRSDMFVKPAPASKKKPPQPRTVRKAVEEPRPTEREPVFQKPASLTKRKTLPVVEEPPVVEQSPPTSQEIPLDTEPPELPIINVEYLHWALIPTKKLDGFFVYGENVATGNYANSSRVVDRAGFMIVKSSSGAVIQLLGAPDKKEMAKYYISRDFISLFSKGFPKDWEKLMAKELFRLRNANEGIKTRIMTQLKDMIKQRETCSHNKDVTLTSQSQLSLGTSTIVSTTKKGNKSTKVQNLPTISETIESDSVRIGPHVSVLFFCNFQVIMLIFL